MTASLDASVLSSVDAESVWLETNGIQLHTVQAGPEDGPLVILLHGFPECWYGWHRQLGPLAKAGYRVVAVDQRGYNLSDKPTGVDSYHLDELAADIVGIIDACNRETASVAGHDWGATVAWWLGMEYPGRLDRLCIVNVPHPTVMTQTLKRSRSQRRKSWYILGFQLPIVPEVVSQLGNWWLPTRSLESTSRTGTFTASDLDRYRTAWAEPGAFTAMVNWYRAIVRYRPQPSGEGVSTPTLILWGTDDEFLETSMAPDSLNYCENGQLQLVDEASHWILHEEPALVVETLLDHLPEPPVSHPERP